MVTLTGLSASVAKVRLLGNILLPSLMVTCPSLVAHSSFLLFSIYLAVLTYPRHPYGYISLL